MTDQGRAAGIDFAVVLRGYDREQVDGFITELVANHEAQRAECERLRRDLAEERQRTARVVAELHEAERTAEARLQAARLQAQARLQAEARLRSDAHDGPDQFQGAGGAVEPGVAEGEDPAV